eukprot:INCI17668.2.p1 GENE.INCI17668.2~~INCI17668.2.p1  ORF type:complete len:993 (+),score=224.46 INCI17668.2:372-3350(+)
MATVVPQEMIANLVAQYGRQSVSTNIAGWLRLCGLQHLAPMFHEIGVSEVQDFWLVDKHDLQDASLTPEQIAAFEAHRNSFDSAPGISPGQQREGGTAKTAAAQPERENTASVPSLKAEPIRDSVGMAMFSSQSPLSLSTSPSSSSASSSLSSSPQTPRRILESPKRTVNSPQLFSQSPRRAETVSSFGGSNEGAADADALVRDIQGLLHQLHRKRTQLHEVDETVSDAAVVEAAIAEATRGAHSVLLEQKWQRELEDDEDRIEELKITRLQQKVREFEALYNEELQSYEHDQQELEKEVEKGEIETLQGHLEAEAKAQQEAIQDEYQRRKEALQNRIQARKQAAERRASTSTSLPEDAAAAKVTAEFQKAQADESQQLNAQRAASSSRLQKKLAARQRAVALAESQKMLRDNLARAAAAMDESKSSAQSVDNGDTNDIQPTNGSPRSPSSSSPVDDVSPWRQSKGDGSLSLSGGGHSKALRRLSDNSTGSNGTSPHASRLRSDTADQVKRLLAVAKRLQARRETAGRTNGLMESELAPQQSTVPPSGQMPGERRNASPRVRRGSGGMPGAPSAAMLPPPDLQRNPTTVPVGDFDDRREQHYNHMDRHFSEWTTVYASQQQQLLLAQKQLAEDRRQLSQEREALEEAKRDIERQRQAVAKERLEVEQLKAQMALQKKKMRRHSSSPAVHAAGRRRNKSSPSMIGLPRPRSSSADAAGESFPTLQEMFPEFQKLMLAQKQSQQKTEQNSLSPSSRRRKAARSQAPTSPSWGAVSSSSSSPSSSSGSNSSGASSPLSSSDEDEDGSSIQRGTNPVAFAAAIAKPRNPRSPRRAVSRGTDVAVGARPVDDTDADEALPIRSRRLRRSGSLSGAAATAGKTPPSPSRRRSGTRSRRNSGTPRARASSGTTQLVGHFLESAERVVARSPSPPKQRTSISPSAKKRAARPTSPSRRPSGASPAWVQELQELRDKLDDGLLTKQQFQDLKASLLKRATK